MTLGSKNTSYWLLTLVLLSAVLGGWFGQRLSDRDGSNGDTSQKPDQNSAYAGGGALQIEYPPPLPSAPISGPPESAAAYPSEAKNIKKPASAPDIVPGGAIEGAIVDRMWEVNANQSWQTRSQPLTPPNWYITGVVQRGSETQIIVRFDDDPVPRFFRVGDTLPGGGKLSWVRPDAIGVITPNHKKIDVPVLAGEWSRTQAASAPTR